VLRHGIKASNKACGQMLPTLLETLPGRFQQVRRSSQTTTKYSAVGQVCTCGIDVQISTA
jgi:hypothetical protein